jgi:hypothetical protein
MAAEPIEMFRRAAAEDAVEIQRSGDGLRLVAHPRVEGFPSRYHGLFFEVEHFVKAADGTVAVVDDPMPFSISFPDDYLRSGDPTLLFRVAQLHGPLFHPNFSPNTPILCLGIQFRPGTRLRSVVHQLYQIVRCENFATDSALNVEAAIYYATHLDAVRALKARPLWRHRLARNVVRAAAGSKP